VPELKSWGVGYSADMHHCLGFYCLCGGEISIDPIEQGKLLVGFSKDGPGIVGERVGILIFECDQCFEKYWFHCDELVVRGYKRSTRWPKD
jgi:hypothetical protein